MIRDPFTDEEHKLRAMLAGFIYRAGRGYYYKPGHPIKTNWLRIDAITMEPIDEAEKARRAEKMFNRPLDERYYSND